MRDQKVDASIVNLLINQGDIFKPLIWLDLAGVLLDLVGLGWIWLDLAGFGWILYVFLRARRKFSVYLYVFLRTGDRFRVYLYAFLRARKGLEFICTCFTHAGPV